MNDLIFCHLYDDGVIVRNENMLTSVEAKCGREDLIRSQKCVAMCMDRYMDSFNLVSKAYTKRLQQEASRR